MSTQTLDVSNILLNPRNSRDLSTDAEKDGLKPLVESIEAFGVTEPIRVMMVTPENAGQFGLPPSAANKEKPVYVAMSGNRRITAIRQIVAKLAAKHAENPTNDALGRKIDRLSVVPVIVEDPKLKVTETVLRMVLPNTQRPDLSIVAKARDTELFRNAVYAEKIDAIMARTGWSDEKKAEARAEIEAKYTANTLVTDKSIATMMGVSPSTVSRYRAVLTFPKKVQALFDNKVLKEANVSDVSNAIKRGATEDEIVAAVTSDKDKTLETLKAALDKIRAAGGTGSGTKAGGQTGGSGSGETSTGPQTDPVKVIMVAAFNGRFGEDACKASPRKDGGIVVSSKASKRFVDFLLQDAPDKATKNARALLGDATIELTRDSMLKLASAWGVDLTKGATPATATTETTEEDEEKENEEDGLENEVERMAEEAEGETAEEETEVPAKKGKK